MKNMSLIKKFTLFALCALTFIPAFLFTGCGNKGPDYEKQGYTAVYSVEYRTNNIITFRSYYTIKCDNSKEITREEYYNLDCDELTFSQFSYNSNKQPEHSVGTMIKYHDYQNYYRGNITGIYDHFVYVKIINENQLEIIQDQKHMLINTDYFEIEYFI